MYRDTDFRSQDAYRILFFLRKKSSPLAVMRNRTIVANTFLMENAYFREHRVIEMQRFRTAKSFSLKNAH